MVAETILFLNNCEMTNEGPAGIPWKLAAGAGVTDEKAEALSKLFTMGTGGHDYLTVDVQVDNTNVTMMPGDLLILRPDNKITVVSNPGEALTEVILENSGLVIHSYKHNSYD